MPFECPICETAAETLLPIVNAGKGYKECCNRCESLATLIVQNYPYGQAWFKRPVPALSLMIYGTAGSRADKFDLKHPFQKANFMKTLRQQGAEIKCPSCNGSGFAKVQQPSQPDRKIYPPPCKECLGKGRIETPRP
jgi:hypothetical protein